MTEKIEWYKEIMELEPNSKVFFPLARLLVENDDQAQAIQVLEQGLERHPDYMEARLFLIELMYRNGLDEACAQQVQKLSNLFSRYAGFWQAWAACLSHTPGDGDTASIVRFLAAHFLVGPLQISEVLNLGLAEIVKNHQGPGIVDAPACTAASAAKANADMPHTPDLSDAENNVENSAPLADALSEKAAEVIITEAPAPESVGAAVDLETFQPVNLEDADNLESVLGEAAEENAPISPDKATISLAKDEGSMEIPKDAPEQTASDSESVSLRTRSMAEVLADQGDYQGALDIYEELAGSERNPHDLENMRQRMEELKSLVSARIAPEEEAVPLATPSQKKERLLGILEALAKRVEARMHS